MALAKTILSHLGQELVGRTILARPMGGWPGGLCKVTEINPDPAAPEIVFNVKNMATGEEIGMFDDEVIVLKKMVAA